MNPKKSMNSSKIPLERVLSKMGYCSRSQARLLIQSGKVFVKDRPIKNPEHLTFFAPEEITVEGHSLQSPKKIYLMLNKPRGFVTTTSDEQGKKTVYDCLATLPGKEPLPWISPVGRLDKASEGLLLFSNDTQWANQITAPESHLDKTYHVQINCIADESLLQKMKKGITLNTSESLFFKEVVCLRQGQRNSWLLILLDEGKNRHIRRLLEAMNIQVLRLIRVAIGSLELGDLPKGQYRFLTSEEREFLRPQKK